MGSPRSAGCCCWSQDPALPLLPVMEPTELGARLPPPGRPVVHTVAALCCARADDGLPLSFRVVTPANLLLLLALRLVLLNLL